MEKKIEKPQLENVETTENDANTASLEEQLLSMQEEVAQWKDKNVRLYADFDNYRKRTSKEKLDLIRTASENVVLSLLPVIDDFERALVAELIGLEAVSGAASIKIDTELAKGTSFEGIALIYTKLSNMLTHIGVEPIDIIGQAFDEQWCEAVAQVPATEDKNKGLVIEVVLKGYKIDNKVIRHAKVVVGI